MQVAILDYTWRHWAQPVVLWEAWTPKAIEIPLRYSSHAFFSSNINWSNGWNGIRVVHISGRKVGSAMLNEDDGLHVCTFNKDFTRVESFFKIKILNKNCSLHELSIIVKKKKRIVIWVNFSFHKGLMAEKLILNESW